MTPEETSNFKSESSIRRFCDIVVNCFCRFGNFVRRLMRLDHNNSENYEICDIETSSRISGATTVSGFTITALETHITSDLDTESYTIQASSDETLDETIDRSNLNRSTDPSSGENKSPEVIKASVVKSEPLMIVEEKSMARPSKSTAQIKDVQNVNNGIDKHSELHNGTNLLKLNKTEDLSTAESNQVLVDHVRQTGKDEGSGSNPEGKFINPHSAEIPTENSSDKSKTDPEKFDRDIDLDLQDTTSSGELSGKQKTNGIIQDASHCEIVTTIAADKPHEDVNSEDDKTDPQEPDPCRDTRPTSLDIHAAEPNVTEFKEDSLCNGAALRDGQKSKISDKLHRKSSPFISSCLSSVDVDEDSNDESTSPSKISKKSKIISPARIFRRLSGKSKLPIPTRVVKNEKIKESSIRDKSKRVGVRGSISDTDSIIESIKERFPCTSASLTKSENSTEISREKHKTHPQESNTKYDQRRLVHREPNECGEIVESLLRYQNSPDTLKSAGDGNISKESESSITERSLIISTLPLSKLTLSIKNLTRKCILLEIFYDQLELGATINIQDIIFYELCMELCADPYDRKLVSHVDRKFVTHLLRSPYHFTDRQLNVELVELFRDALVQYSQVHQNKVQLETKLRHLRLMRNENFSERINHVVSDAVLDIRSESEDESDDSEVDNIKTFNDIGTCTNVEEPTIAYITVPPSMNTKRFIPRDPTRYIKKNEKCIQFDDSIENEFREAKKKEDLYSIAYQREMFNIGAYRMDDHVNVEKAKKGSRPEEKQKVKTRGIPNKHLESLEADHEVLNQDSTYIEDLGEEATAFGEKAVIEENDGKSQKIDYKAEPVILDMRHMEEVPVKVIQNRRKSSPPSSGKKKRKNKRRLSNESVVKKLDLSFHISGQL